MSDPLSPILFTSRGRPVQYQPGKWGGALVAVERGYFPISSTGYRSVSGLCGPHDHDATAFITPEFLEELASKQDRERRSALASVERPRLAGPDPLSNHVFASIAADHALEEGFFAPEAERAALWGEAFRVLSLIDTDARFQPLPSAPAWTEAHCAEAMKRNRESLALLRQLARGDFSGRPLRRHLSASAYFALPPKQGGEPCVPLPAIAAEFGLDLPTASAQRARRAIMPNKSKSPGPETDQQLPLL
jgi:hypothetical protein